MPLRIDLPLGIALVALVGCASRQAPIAAPVTTTPTRDAPAWIDQEEMAGGLAAVGIAQPNPMGDKGMQRTIALADARTKLAGKVKVRVQSLFSQLNQQLTGVTAGTSAPPVKTDVMNRVLENVTRQLVDQELVGGSTRATWTDPQDGSLYLLLTLTRDAADRAMASTTKTEIRKQVARGQPRLAEVLPEVDTAIAALESEESLNADLDRLDPAAGAKP
jgi:hypothetical protein